MSSHRFDQIFDKVGETVSIYERTAGSEDAYGNIPYTWELEATETAILPNPTTKSFAEMIWAYLGQNENRDRLAYFKAGSIVEKNMQIETSNGERYEIDIVDDATVFGSTMLKIGILRRLTEQ